FQAEDGIRDGHVTGVQTCALPISAIDELWNLITLPTLNLPADEGSLLLATMVFRTGLLDAADACDIGVPAVPLQRLHGDAATDRSEERRVGKECRGRGAEES